MQDDSLVINVGIEEVLTTNEFKPKEKIFDRANTHINDSCTQVINKEMSNHFTNNEKQ